MTPDEITILLQGNYNEETARIIARMRSLAPTIPIVLSCWETNRAAVVETCPTNVTTVFSKDPGTPAIPGFKGDNIRRQIVSSSNGLMKVITPWVVKIRSDVYIDPRVLTRLTALCAPVDDKGVGLFSHRVVATSLTTLDGGRSGLYFHVCDWVYLGRTEDIRSIFSVPLPEGEFFTYFQNAEPAPEICSRYRSESYLVYHLVRDKLGIQYPFSGHIDPALAQLSRQILSANFAIVNPWNLGLSSSKHRRLYLWLRPDRHSELTCGSYIKQIDLVRGAAALSLDLVSRTVSVIVSMLITVRNKVRAWWA